jgi:hypothetical protein
MFIHVQNNLLHEINTKYMDSSKKLKHPTGSGATVGFPFLVWKGLVILLKAPSDTMLLKQHRLKGRQS